LTKRRFALCRDKGLTIHSSRTRFAGRLNSGVRGHSMSIAVAKKPRRVNIAALLNILVGVVGLSAILLLSKDPGRHFQAPNRHLETLDRCRIDLAAYPFICLGSVGAA
jgi:hypothetical protein